MIRPVTLIEHDIEGDAELAGFGMGIDIGGAQLAIPGGDRLRRAGQPGDRRDAETLDPEIERRQHDRDDDPGQGQRAFQTADGVVDLLQRKRGHDGALPSWVWLHQRAELIQPRLSARRSFRIGGRILPGNAEMTRSGVFDSSDPTTSGSTAPLSDECNE